MAARITDELAKGEAFRIVDRPNEVFGELQGVVRGTHMRSAIKRVLAEGATCTDPKGVKDLWTLALKPV